MKGRESVKGRGALMRSVLQRSGLDLRSCGGAPGGAGKGPGVPSGASLALRAKEQEVASDSGYRAEASSPGFAFTK